VAEGAGVGDLAAPCAKADTAKLRTASKHNVLRHFMGISYRLSTKKKISRARYRALLVKHTSTEKPKFLKPALLPVQ
jgi:hypothetical protein